MFPAGTKVWPYMQNKTRSWIVKPKTLTRDVIMVLVDTPVEAAMMKEHFTNNGKRVYRFLDKDTIVRKKDGTTISGFVTYSKWSKNA